MAEAKSAKKRTKKASTGFTDEERAAMRERAREAKAAGRRGADKADGESEVLAKIAEMQESDRVMAERLHQIIKATAPDLSPRTWYGMPAYAKDGKVICFFQSGQKFKTRYATFGFSEKANLDDGAMPAGLGWHPWFRSPVDVTIPAAMVYESNHESSVDGIEIHRVETLREAVDSALQPAAGRVASPPARC